MADGNGDISDQEIYAAGRRLRIDAWTAKVVAALQAAEIRPILLKGPATARWLYPDDLLARSYCDIDLMVAPGQRSAAEDVLRQLGYDEQVLTMPGEERHSRAWADSLSGISVDLHRYLHGMERVDEDEVWRLVSTATETLDVRETVVEVPGPHVRSLHLALHLGPLDREGTQAWTDLGRGLAHLPPDDWRGAAALARAFGLDAEMGVRLRRHPEGLPMAESLGLPAKPPELYAVREAVITGQAVGTAYAIAQLRARPTLAAKARYVAQKLVPPPSVIRRRASAVRLGRLGLMAGYARRAAGGVARLPRALADWNRVRPR